MMYVNFELALRRIAEKLSSAGRPLKAQRWQSREVKDTAMGRMWEVLNIYFQVPIPPKEEWAKQIKPNLPWADDHFQERVGGLPLNPGNEYKNWPYYKGKAENDTFRTEAEKFSHTYMERFWPKYAGGDRKDGQTSYGMHTGIRYEYGDLDDVINHLKEDPETRQAFLPVWFPEDTGVKHGGRVPCTIGYLFMQRDGYLHVTYWIRSCDFFRHFRDDIYLALNLGLFILDRLKELDPRWEGRKLGMFTMHIANLHIFEQEIPLLNKI
jgi:hypothetical protein